MTGSNGGAGISRRKFIGGAISATALAGCGGGRLQANSRRTPESSLETEWPSLAMAREKSLDGIRKVVLPDVDLIKISGGTPEALVATGFKALGVLPQIAAGGATCIISPDWAYAREPGSGAVTSPKVVNALITACTSAGCGDIICMEHGVEPAARAYEVNGAYKAIKGTDARLLVLSSPEQFIRLPDFEKGKLHREDLRWQAVASALLRADALITAPVLKHHRDVIVSGAVTRLLGCVWRRRAYHHVDINTGLAELAAVIRPSLIVMDATRVLTSGGPAGPGRVRNKGTILMGTDPVLMDAFACDEILDMDPDKVAYLKLAEGLGVGSTDYKSARIERIAL